MLNNRKILIGVTGSIAAYKTATLIRLLIKEGAEIKVIMTSSACDFISPLTLGTLAKTEVLIDISNGSSWANHVELGRWADAMVIAPLSCNTLFKMAHGACDNLLLAVYLSATCPVIVAPAMDEDMWLHPATKSNISAITSYGNHVIPVNDGELASGLVGPGRMAEPEEILEWLQQFFVQGKELKGKNVLITAGPTHEAIDPVRFLGNASSGKMGVALAKEIYSRGGTVTLVTGPTQQVIPEGIQTVRVTSAAEMYSACVDRFDSMDWAIMSAAVADYTPMYPAGNKIKKTDEGLVLELQKTKDILKSLGEMKTSKQCLVGFALETDNEVANAKAKLVAKQADLIVLNSLKDQGAGFGHDTNKISIFDKNGVEYLFENKHKNNVAVDIVNTIIKYTHE